MNRKLLTIRLGERAFALDLAAIQELRAWVPPTPIPRAPPHVRGLLNLRGAILPVVDLAGLLGWPGAEPGPRQVIAVLASAEGSGARLCGLVVDAVTDIVEVAPEEVLPLPDDCGAQRAFLQGFVARGEELLMVLAAERLFPDAGAPLAAPAAEAA